MKKVHNTKHLKNNNMYIMYVCMYTICIIFKKGTSTTQSTYCMLETIDHYNFMKSSTFVLMLDVSIVSFLGSH